MVPENHGCPLPAQLPQLSPVQPHNISTLDEDGAGSARRLWDESQHGARGYRFPRSRFPHERQDFTRIEVRRDAVDGPDIPVVRRKIDAEGSRSSGAAAALVSASNSSRV